MSIAVSVDVAQSGPFLDGDPGRVFADAIGQAVKDAGEYGVHALQQQLDAVLVNPTGFYRSQVTYALREDSVAQVTDGGVVYGPWLAGTSSRNERSRFKGYAHWRRAMQDVDDHAVDVVERRVAEAVEALS